MNKKEFTKKQLRKQLTTLTEGKADIKSELKKAYKALKTLKSLLVGHKTGDQTLSFSDLKKIKTAARHIEDIYEDMTDEEMTDKESEKEKETEKKNEQSEGHGEMYNALQGVREGKVVKINEGTLKRIVGRVIKEQKKDIPWWAGVVEVTPFAKVFKSLKLIEKKTDNDTWTDEEIALAKAIGIALPAKLAKALKATIKVATK